VENEIRTAHKLINQLPAPTFTDDDLTSIHPRILPSFVRSELGQQYKFLDRDILKPELSKRLRDPVVKQGGIEPFAREEQFQYPEYNFSEIVTIVETEPLVARAFSRKEIMCLKQGWDFVGKNQKTVEYIRSRLNEIAHVSGVSTHQLIRDMASDLIMFSNWFGALVRNSKYSSGRRRNVGGRELEPIAGIYSIPAETVTLKFNKKGDVTAIAQQIWGSGLDNGKKKNIFGKNRYLHFKVNERKGYSVGTPLLVATRDDIMALRRIEENVEILLYQYLFPLYKYQVGTETAPAREFPGGVSEIDLVQRKWAELPPEGAMVVPERHDIDVLGAKGAAIDAQPYLQYFKKRVLAGLEISSLDIGDADTSNRSTSDSLSRILVDGVKYLQRRIEWNFNQYVIKPLLMESTFSDDEVLDPENMVYLRFKEIDLEELMKIQNHYQQMYSAHGITETEFRRLLGREPLTMEEREDTFWKRIDEPRELIKAKQSGFSAEADALAKNENSSITPAGIAKEQQNEKKQQQQSKQAAAGAGEPTRTAGQRQSNSRNRPSNQFGTKSAATGRKSSESLYKLVFNDNAEEADPNKIVLSRNSLMTYWLDTLNKLSTFPNEVNPDLIQRLFGINMFAASTSFNQLLLSKLYEGVRDALKESGSTEFSFNVRVSSVFLQDIEKQVDSLIAKLVKDVEQKAKLLDTHDNLLPVDLINTLTFRVKFIDGNETSRAYNLGRALGFRHLGHTEVQVQAMRSDACDDCKRATRISLDDLTYMKMPPLAHPNARQIVVPVTK
jgi:hypothetical protein